MSDSLATIEAIANRIKTDMKRFERQVEEVKGADDADKSELYEAAKDFEKRLKKVISSYKREIESMDDESLQRKYRKKADKVEGDFKELRRALKFESTATERGILLSRRDGAGESKGERTTDSVLREAGATAQSTTARLERTLQTVNDTTEIGTATAQRMVEQTEQIGRITTTVKTMDEDLRKADKLIARFMRRLYTDKVILAFTFLVVCAIAAIVIVSSTTDTTIGNLPDEATFDPDKLEAKAKELYGEAEDAVNGRTLRGVTTGFTPNA